jgi:hypothetical protein
MADDTTVTPAPGVSTSEYSMTKWVMILGYAAFGIGVAMDVLTAVSSSFPTLTWVGPVLNVLGLVSGLLAQLGYNRGRVLVKTAASAATAAKVAPK